MCGIVGFTGNRQAAPILLDGLSKLEYRGYDSAGLAVRETAVQPYRVPAVSVIPAGQHTVNQVRPMRIRMFLVTAADLVLVQSNLRSSVYIMVSSRTIPN